MPRSADREIHFFYETPLCPQQANQESAIILDMKGGEADTASQAQVSDPDRAKRLDAVFRAYDIRGLVPAELNAELVHDIGRAFADFAPEGTIAVGRDMRIDSEALAEAFVAGLVQQGREVLDIGMVTTDMASFAVGQYDLAGAAMITASHNPGDYDGIKLTVAGVTPVGQDSGLQDIKQIVLRGAYKIAGQEGKKLEKNILNDWVEHALSFAGGELKPLRIAIDAGNGMGAIAAPKLQELTPLEISGLYMELDGTFPNHPANPLLPEAVEELKTHVTRNELDCGIAFDGDGDRCFFVDEKGEIITASQLGALLADTFLQENPHATVIYNAVIGDIVPELVEADGGTAIRCPVGHTYVQEAMIKHGAIFGCEHAGHFFYRDNFSADSGLITAVMVLGIISQNDKKLSELIKPYRKYVSIPEENIAVRDWSRLLAGLKQTYGDYQLDELDGLTVRDTEHSWWASIRPSNTEPYVRFNLEAHTKTELAKAAAELRNTIKKFTA